MFAKKTMIVGILLPLFDTAVAASEFKHEWIVTGGVNNKLPQYRYVIAEGEVSWRHDFENGYAVKAMMYGEYEDYGKEKSTGAPKKKKHKGKDKDDDDDDKGNKSGKDAYFRIEGETPAGTLYYGALKKKGASESFFKKNDGMSIVASKYKNDYNSLAWHGKHDGFGYAVSWRDVGHEHFETWSLGGGYKSKTWSFGVGYDHENKKQREMVGISGKYQHDLGSISNTYGLAYSYAPKNKAYSFGASLDSEIIEGLTVGTHYAYNHKGDAKKKKKKDAKRASPHAYGVSFKFRRDDYEFSSKWSRTKKGHNKYTLDAEYLFKDVAPRGTTLYAGYKKEKGKEDENGAYIGVVAGLHDHVKLGLAYAQGNEMGDLDFLKGASLFIRAEF